MTAPRRDPAKPWGAKKSQPPVTEPPTLLSPPSTEPLRRAPLCRACGLWFPEKTGVFNISMGGGFRDRPGACRNVGNPGRSVPRFCQVEGFSALSMAGGFRDRPAGCWKGGKAAPSSRLRNVPAPSRRPQGGSKKAKEKGHPPGCPSSFTDRTPPDSGYGLLVLTSCCGSGAFPSGSRTPCPQGKRTTHRPP